MAHNVTLYTLDGRRIGTPDGYFPRAGVAVQVHSRQFHRTLLSQRNESHALTCSALR